jgi:hypothetical protein
VRFERGHSFECGIADVEVVREIGMTLDQFRDVAKVIDEHDHAVVSFYLSSGSAIEGVLTGPHGGSIVEIKTTRGGGCRAFLDVSAIIAIEIVRSLPLSRPNA